jgi:hypothetical protein
MLMTAPRNHAALPPKKKKAVRLTASLPDADHTALAAIAERCNVSLSWVIRQAIAEFLENHKTGNLQLPLDLKANGKSRHD